MSSSTCPDADERSDVFAESSMRFHDIVLSFFAGIAASKPTIFEPRSRKRSSLMSWQHSHKSGIRRCGRSRSAHFTQRYRRGVISGIWLRLLLYFVSRPGWRVICTQQVWRFSPSVTVGVSNNGTRNTWLRILGNGNRRSKGLGELFFDFFVV